MFFASKGVNVPRNRVDDMVNNQYEKISNGFDATMQNTLDMLEQRMKQLENVYERS